ncbi:MAG TPA: GrpB family protein [Acidimicrobiales bacterium]|nr:GrpB family protein [Acidimicrobiales bacterium]
MRFDEEVAVPVSHHGSSFRLGPLTDDDARVGVQLMYLGPGGLIGRHAAATRQLLAVVAGAGWASGREETRRGLRAGWGALFEAGESHEAGSDDGMTAVCIEGQFEAWATMVTKDIVVTDYDARWPGWFEQLSAFIWPAVQDVAERIEHVGSTSVPGLAAKPVIDLDIVVAGQDHVRPVIDRLQTIGYRWRGDLGVEGRQAFSRRAAPGAPELPEHHLYLVVEDNRAHQDHWLLRDLLRRDGEARALYADLKRHNAEVAECDMDFYVAAKAELVAQLLTRARAAQGLPAVEYWRPGDG